MRRKQGAAELIEGTSEFIFGFQLAAVGTRHACTVTIEARTRDEASILFRKSWISIEKLARERLAVSASDVNEPMSSLQQAPGSLDLLFSHAGQAPLA